MNISYRTYNNDLKCRSSPYKGSFFLMTYSKRGTNLFHQLPYGNNLLVAYKFLMISHSKCRHRSTNDTNLHIMVIGTHTKFVNKNIVTEWMKTICLHRRRKTYTVQWFQYFLSSEFKSNSMTNIKIL